MKHGCVSWISWIREEIQMAWNPPRQSESRSEQSANRPRSVFTRFHLDTLRGTSRVETWCWRPFVRVGESIFSSRVPLMPLPWQIWLRLSRWRASIVTTAQHHSLLLLHRWSNASVACRPRLPASGNKASDAWQAPSSQSNAHATGLCHCHRVLDPIQLLGAKDQVGIWLTRARVCLNGPISSQRVPIRHAYSSVRGPMADSVTWGRICRVLCPICVPRHRRQSHLCYQPLWRGLSSTHWSLTFLVQVQHPLRFSLWQHPPRSQ